MRRGLMCFLVVVLLVSRPAVAQQQVTIDDLTAPTSPAFVLLDTAPSAVERPENPKALTLDLINRVSTSKGLPQNYALEVAPYWLAWHPQLTFQTYQNPSVVQSIAQSFSLSVATVPIPGATATAENLGTRLGLGVRTNIWNGHPNPQLADKVGELADANGVLLDILGRTPQNDAERAQNATDEAQARDTIRMLALEVQGMDAERIGFFLTFAAGQVWSYPGDDVSQSLVEKRGVWFTPTYRFRTCTADPCEARIDLIGVLRALKDKAEAVRWDYGGRIVWRARREFYLSVETVRRQGLTATATTPQKSGSHRTVGMLEYRVRTDVVLFGSFGSDFKKDSGVKPLVSLLGVNFGFGQKPVMLADKK